MRLWIFLLFFAGLSTFAETPAEAVEEAPAPELMEDMPFGIGEVLEYQIEWNNIDVGRLTISVPPKVEVDGKPAWKFNLRAKTNGFADKIYKVRLNISSYLSDDLSRTVKYYSDTTEGSRKKVQLFTYDWERMKVHYLKNKTVDRGERDLEALSYDPLGMFYAIRRRVINADTKKMKVWVSDGKRNLESEADIVRQETIEVGDTEYKTFLIEPELKDLKGVFQKSDDAKLQLWLSDDEYHIPVKISSKVIVGSFTATLIKHTKHDGGEK